MTRLENPCKYRHLLCHDNCFLYKEWKVQINIASELIRKQRVIDDGVYHHKKVRKR